MRLWYRIGAFWGSEDYEFRASRWFIVPPPFRPPTPFPFARLP